ncbi:hypothetical protein BGZ94_009915 [Podila epigama]|nr:hypothetical protein BGZ94_009915 [Podila epigama]
MESQQSINRDDLPLTHQEIAKLSFAFCILWFAANWATNASLAYTTVASSTILASMSGFFTLAIGAFLKTETFSNIKFLAVCMSVIGVALVSESDRGDGPRLEPTAPRAPLFGDFLALMSAMFYGCYTVLLKVRIKNESRVNMSLFFGFVGLFNLLLLWPLFGVLHLTGIEPFELPSDTKVIWMIGINAIVGTFVSDYLWLLSMLMTSPLVVTLGLSLTIPLALLGDVVGYGRVLGLGYWIGAGLVLAGFFGVNGAALSERKEEDRLEEVAIQSAAANATAAVAATALDYNPLQYPPPSRVSAGASKANHDMSDMEPVDDEDADGEDELHDHSHPTPTPTLSMPGQLAPETLIKKGKNIQGLSDKAPGTYKLRSPIQPKEFIKGVVLALEGCFIALTNPNFRNGKLCKTLFRLLGFTLIAHLRGLEIFSNKAHELMSSIPLLGLLFLRYLYPQPLDDIFIEGLEYSDYLLLQEHEHAKAQKAQSHLTPKSAESPSSPSEASTSVMDYRGPFTPALLAYPYRVRHWQEMWRYIRRTWRRLKWGLLFLVLSWLPVIGRFAFPVASFISTIQSIGSKPLAVVFAVASFLLPRSVSIYLLKGFFGCRALTRELLDPYFVRVGMSHYQKRKWFNYRKSVLLGFGVVFYVGTSIPIIGVAVFGLAQASSAFVLQSLSDPPPPPVVKTSSPKSKSAKDSTSHKKHE